jgi:hypothetical protein
MFTINCRWLAGPVSAGTKLFVPTTITTVAVGGSFTGPPGQLQLIQANEYGNSAAGYEPIAATAMVGATPVAEANSSGALAYATYEVIYRRSGRPGKRHHSCRRSVTNTPSIGEVQAATMLAPLSSVTTTSLSAPIPRFANFSTAYEAYSITSCPTP